ncbi:MAG: pyruvate dehydrogenase (acetyl-transferring) E1 component subunit alpha [Chthonomonadales bacterium]
MAKTAVKEAVKSENSKEDLLGIYKLMVLIRRFEESTYRKFREGKMGGYLHRYDGQEALVAGVIPQLDLPGDKILCTYRDHAHAIACGTDPKAIMAELMGRATGCALGKGGSMHLIDPDNGFLGGDGIVGGPVPISLGVGFALKYQGSKNVCVCYFGDGAMNQGGVHESFNMVGLYKLPVLYILENNQYAMGTAVTRSTAQTDFVQKAKAHGINGEKVDGMDYFAVQEVVSRVLKHMRETQEPYFLEMNCYRFVGHGVGDDNTQGYKFYRTEEEFNKWKERDPIVKLGDFLHKKGWLDNDGAEAIDQEALRIVDESIEFAEASPEPPLDSLYENVYS